MGLMRQPVVSVVIPVYNGANFLADAILSALSQTYPRIEIIVVNDGSLDDGATRAVALSFGDQIRYFEKENGGCGSAFNFGIRQMRGDYFSWLSHDDLYEPNKVERQLAALSEPTGTAVACCAYRVLEEVSGRTFPQHYFDVDEFERKPLYGLFRGAINGNCLLIPKEVFDEIGLFNESLRTTQDYDLFYRMLRRFSIVYHDDVLVTARVHSQQDTVAKHDLAMRESDRLWSRFIGDAASIGVFSYERSPAEYWAKLANHLWQSPYPTARETVFAELRQAIEAQVPRPEEQPLVSVVIPFVRVDSLLLSAVKSAVEQTYRNLEILLVANAKINEDETAELQSLARVNGRDLKILDGSARRGASYARNRGLDAANGTLIALLDADDFWHLNKIEYQVAVMLGFDCRAVTTAYSQNGLDIKDFAPKQKLYFNARDYLLTLDRIFPTPSFMFRRTDARFDESMHICEDIDFFSKLIGDGVFFELPFKLSIINIKPTYAWNVAEAYAARMSICMARGASRPGDEFETSLFLTMCRVAISRGQLGDLGFIIRNWPRIISLMPGKYVVGKFIRHVAGKLPGAAALAARLRRAGFLMVAAPSPSATPGLAYSLQRAIYRTLVPKRIERRIVSISAGYRELADRLDRTITAHQATHAAQLAQIARLEQTIGECGVGRAADLEEIAGLKQSGVEHQVARAAQVEQIARLEKRIADHRATEAAQVGQIALLKQTMSEFENELVRLRQERAAVLDENSALKGQATALRLANDNQSALITGKLSLLDYQIQALMKSSAGSESGAAERRAYLDLLENALVGLLTDDPAASPWSEAEFDPDIRAIGRDWPRRAMTMIGTVRMRNLRHLLETVIEEGIPGDVIETGVWRGGACIYMRGILSAHHVTDRTVWVADSFRGLPSPDEASFPADCGDKHHTFGRLAVPLDEVKRNFERYGLLDDQVRFLEGWFKDTLPSAPIERLAILRLDGDMYESTIQALDALYMKLSVGGIVIVDDYILEPCRKAVEDFRTKHGITAAIEPVDGAAVFWRKAATEVRDGSAQCPGLRTEEVLA